MGSYTKAIIKTLSYGCLFNYPQTKGELWRYLIWEEKKDPKFSFFVNNLESLLKHKKVFQINKKYYLLKRQPVWVKQREKEEKIAKHKIVIAQRVARILSFIPTVYFIGLSGKLALSLAEKGDDIDLFIITRTGYLWITRLLVVGILSFIGIRRRPGERIVENKICLNMFLDMTHLSLPRKERDLYLAHEVAQLKTLYTKNNSYDQFINKNLWVKDFLPNAVRETKILRENDMKKNLSISQYLYIFISSFETFVQRIQLWYMRGRKSTEIIKTGYVRFHPHDSRQWILVEYCRLIKKHKI